MTEVSSQRLSLTSEIVTSYVANNQLEADRLSDLIRSVFQALGPDDQEAAPARPVPAVPIKRSVFPDYIICLEDGKKLKMLKRHLKSAYDMTPEQYRQKWDLPAQYPMVAPNYASRRSELARELGLGRDITANTKTVEAAPQPAPEPAPEPAPVGRRGRRKKLVPA